MRECTHNNQPINLSIPLGYIRFRIFSFISYPSQKKKNNFYWEKFKIDRQMNKKNQILFIKKSTLVCFVMVDDGSSGATMEMEGSVAIVRGARSDQS